MTLSYKQKSDLFDQQSFYRNFNADLRSCKRELYIESAFLTVKRVNHLLPILGLLVKDGIKITVNTRHPEEHDGFMQLQSLAAVNALQHACITVLYTAGLHRKLAVIDRKVLWEGSLNILSQADSCELMRRTNSETSAESLLSFIGMKKYLEI